MREGRKEKAEASSSVRVCGYVEGTKHNHKHMILKLSFISMLGSSGGVNWSASTCRCMPVKPTLTEATRKKIAAVRFSPVSETVANDPGHWRASGCTNLCP